MRNLHLFRILAVVACTLFCVMGTSAQEKEAYAALSDDGQTVTFYYDTQKASRKGFGINNTYNSYHPYTEVTTVKFDTSFALYRPVSTKLWFWLCRNLVSIIGIENLKTENVTDMFGMFCGCSALTSLDLSNFNTEKVTNMHRMFHACTSLKTLNLSSFNTENVTDMGTMFRECYDLTSLDLSNFNTTNVTNMQTMFYKCYSLKGLNLNNFHVENVTDMFEMFAECTTLANLDLSNFKTENVTNMGNMFYHCSSLVTIYADEEKWSTASVANGNDWNMFRDCTALVGGNGTKYNANYTDKRYARIDKEGLPGYLTQKSSMGIMVNKREAITSNRWYMLDGRCVTGEPSQRGVYVKGGCKVVWK